MVVQMTEYKIENDIYFITNDGYIHHFISSLFFFLSFFFFLAMTIVFKHKIANKKE